MDQVSSKQSTNEEACSSIIQQQLNSLKRRMDVLEELNYSKGIVFRGVRMESLNAKSYAQAVHKILQLVFHIDPMTTPVDMASVQRLSKPRNGLHIIYAQFTSPVIPKMVFSTNGTRALRSFKRENPSTAKDLTVSHRWNARTVKTRRLGFVLRERVLEYCKAQGRSPNVAVTENPCLLIDGRPRWFKDLSEFGITAEMVQSMSKDIFDQSNQGPSAKKFK